MGIGDFAVDDDFVNAWTSHPSISRPWWQVSIDSQELIDKVTIVEEEADVIKEYRLEYYADGQWYIIYAGPSPTPCRVKQHTFAPVHAEAVRITVTRFEGIVKIAELGVYRH